MTDERADLEGETKEMLLRESGGEATKPEWIRGLLSETFFAACGVHENSSKNEKNLFCLDCHISFCAHCRSSHASHSVVQVRRVSHQDALQLEDVKKFIHCSDIMQYTAHGARVIYLKHRPQRVKGAAKCINCEGTSKGPGRFCSLSCKVDDWVNRGEDLSNLLRPSSKPSPTSGSRKRAPAWVASDSDKTDDETPHARKKRISIALTPPGSGSGPNSGDSSGMHSIDDAGMRKEIAPRKTADISIEQENDGTTNDVSTRSTSSFNAGAISPIVANSHEKTHGIDHDPSQILKVAEQIILPENEVGRATPITFVPRSTSPSSTEHFDNILASVRRLTYGSDPTIDPADFQFIRRLFAQLYEAEPDVYADPMIQRDVLKAALLILESFPTRLSLSQREACVLLEVKLKNFLAYRNELDDCESIIKESLKESNKEERLIQNMSEDYHKSHAKFLELEEEEERLKKEIARIQTSKELLLDKKESLTHKIQETGQRLAQRKGGFEKATFKKGTVAKELDNIMTVLNSFKSALKNISI